MRGCLSPESKHGEWLGTIDLHTVLSIALTPASASGPTTFGLQIQTTDRLWELWAPNELGRSQWIEKINHFVSQRQYVSRLEGWLVKEGSVRKSWKRRFRARGALFLPLPPVAIWCTCGFGALMQCLWLKKQILLLVVEHVGLL